MKIAILSNGNANYSTKRLKEEALLRGHEVSIIKYKNCFVSIEGGKPTVFYKGKPLEYYDAIIPRIATKMTKYGTTILRQLETSGAWALSSSLAINRARDKIRSIQVLAKTSGIGIPKTVLSQNSSDIDELINQVGGTPVVIKVAQGTHGNGVVLAETKKAAKSVLQALQVFDNSGASIFIQEFIEESAGTDIRAFVVGGRVVASMERKSLDDDFRSNLHKGGLGKIIKLTNEEKKMAVKAARAMGLAVAGVDLMRSNKGPIVLEVNASPGFGIEHVTKRNVARAIIKYVELNAKRCRKKDRVGV